MTCGVCLNAFSTILRKAIACPYCSESACSQCMKIYILDNASNPKCMHCNRLFTNEFVDTTFTKQFRRGDLRKRKVSNLLELEKSLVPETMPIVEQRKRSARMRYLTNVYHMSTNDLDRYAYGRESGSIDDLMNSVRTLVVEMRQLSLQNMEVRDATIRTVKYLKCPACPGYISISNTGQCSNCEYKICRACREPDGDGHECSQDALKTMELVKDLCKPCPKCGTQIERISGCAQMFCTDCHTAFSWTTGAIVTGPIHNPHYFEFVRRTGVNMQANNCEENVQNRYLWTGEAVNNYIRSKKLHKNCNDHDFDECTHKGMCRVFAIMEVSNWVLAWAQRELVQYTNTTYTDLRIQFIEGKITEAHFAKLLGLQETHRIKKNRIAEVHKMYATVALDTFNRLNASFVTAANEAEIAKVFDEFYKCMVAVRQYAEDALRAVYEDYSDTTFRFVDSNFKMKELHL